MDPVTQGAVGAAFAQTSSKHRWLFKAAAVGALGGMAPDLDVLIQSGEDPLLALEYHRQFTHSLFFIPIGGALVGLLAYWLAGRRWRFSLGQSLLWAIMGYATHGLLDGCTSYGTQLLWPLSNTRFSWDLVSVVDPLVTVPLLALVITAGIRKRRRWVAAGVVWLLIYLALAGVQRDRAIALGYKLAAERGHSVERLEAKPSFANIVVWKTIYESGESFHVDAVKPGLGGPRIWEGDRIARLDPERDFPWLDPGSQQARDIQRFRWFSAGYLAVDPRDPTRIVDVRYSLLPQRISGLWGIALDRRAGPDQHVTYFTDRGDTRAAADKLWTMIRE